MGETGLRRKGINHCDGGVDTFARRDAATAEEEESKRQREKKQQQTTTSFQPEKSPHRIKLPNVLESLSTAGLTRN